QEGDVVTGGGQVVDQEFLDYINENQESISQNPEENLHIGQPAPWDNPEDPFWQQEKPEGWKGHWPGGPQEEPNPTPGENLPPEDGRNPGTPGKDPRPETPPTTPPEDRT